MRWTAAAVALCASWAGCVAPSPRAVQEPAWGMPASVADSDFLYQYAVTRRFSLGRPQSVKLVPDGSAVLFLRSGPRSFVQDLYEFDTRTGEERVLLTAEGILQGADEQLSAEELARRERMRMTARGIATYDLSEDGSRILVPLSGRLFVIDRKGGEVKELPGDGGFPLDPRFSPDGRFVSCVRDGDLYVIEVASRRQRRLTHSAAETITNGLAEFVAQEEMGRYAGHWWSPDSTRIAYQQTDTADVEVLYIMDAMHPEQPPQSWPYPRAGTDNADVRLGVIDIAGGETRWVQWDRSRYPYLATVRWEKEAPLNILVQNRTQTEEVLYEVDISTGRVSSLLVERDPAWINLDQDMPYWLGEDNGFLWTTERCGMWELELRGSDGAFIASLTPPDFIYKGLAGFDETNRIAYVLGGEDPRQTHLYRFDLATLPVVPQRMTEQDGIHSAVFSKNHRVYVQSAATLSGDVRHSVRRTDGSELGRLTSVAAEPPFLPHPEFVLTRGSPQLPAVLVRPRNFDMHRKYPVLVSVYGGPHAQTVVASARRYLLHQWMADHGFIVVSIDGRGTPSRGRTWERAIKGNLIDIPLDDQVAGLQWLGGQYPELDMDRVGIYGWSFGGYFSAMAVMRRPDVFHVGVAGAPVCDWQDYDTHYTERYLGLPQENPDGYEKSSVLSYSAALSRPLLIIHGTADDNVYFMHSLKMSNALFRSGRRHQFLPLSDFTHMVADPTVTVSLNERIMSFFQRHLMEYER